MVFGKHSRSSRRFPVFLGYRMPAEWEPHRATWLSWPRNRVTWPGRLLKETRDVYLQMMRALLPGERVNLLVENQKTARSVQSILHGVMDGPNR